MSDSLIIMILLNLSGGTQDACSYFLRDHVFANAQTGNIVLMGCYLISEDLRDSIRYFLPVFCFALGVLTACFIRSKCRHTGKIHWRHLVLVMEILLLFVVGFLPPQVNWLANALTSFACAMQVQSFRTVSGSAYASTMCIGNLRSGMDHLYRFITGKKKEEGKTAAIYLTAITSFAIGAACGGHLTTYFSYRTIWISCGILILCFLLMLIEEEEDLEVLEKKERKELQAEKNLVKKRTRRASGGKTSDERNRKRISAKNFQRISTEIFKTRRTTVQTAALLIFISYF
ncbi:DUF1275 domain-containing protein [Clostridium sp. AF27-2AA]|nr:DUF1275 domain-containing protein [Clostridium sp. AF27-2AA]